jgi:predicted transcriptional regulator
VVFLPQKCGKNTTDEIARLTEISHPTVSKYVKELKGDLLAF